MAMLLAKQHDIGSRISLVNDPFHRALFETLDVQVVSDPASIVAQRLYQQLPASD